MNLLDAVVAENVDILSVLPNATQDAMSHAINEASPSMVALLLRHGVVPTQESFYRAFKNECVEIIEMLIPFVDLTHTVYYAMTHWCSLHVVRRLLEAGAIPDPRAVARALMTSVPYVQLLLEYGASPFVDIPLYASDTSRRVIQKAQLRILEDNHRNAVACFIACYRPLRYTEEEGVIDERFIHPMAHLTWAHGVRPIRKRLLDYLVERRVGRGSRARIEQLRGLLA
jgi:hypothetical protein